MYLHAYNLITNILVTTAKSVVTLSVNNVLKNVILNHENFVNLHSCISTHKMRSKITVSNAVYGKSKVRYMTDRLLLSLEMSIMPVTFTMTNTLFSQVTNNVI